MGVLDFLFEGKPPASVTTYGTSTESIPQWMSDYTQGLLGRANQVASVGYQPYEAPRIAGFSPDQNKAFDMTRANVGAYKPYLDQAGALTQAAAGTDIQEAAAPYMTEAGKRAPGNLQQYIDPYVENVIGRAELEANRNFNENIIPKLNGQFTASGQFGSSAHEREANRAARDVTEGLQSTSLGALSQAYGQAGQQFQSDESRQAQLATTSGDLANKQAALGLDAARTTGALGQSAQASGLQDAAALSAAGADQQNLAQKNLDLAHSDFEEQRDYPKDQVDWLSSVIRGMPTPVSKATTSTAPYQGDMQPGALSQIGSILSAGKGIYDIYKGKARGGIIRPVRTSGALRFAAA